MRAVMTMLLHVGKELGAFEGVLLDIADIRGKDM